eukprot:tig00020592_g11639.t1
MAEVYKHASGVLGRMLSKKGAASAKTLILAPSSGVPEAARQATYALVCNTLKYKAVLDQIIELTPTLAKDKHKPPPALLYVLLYDLLVGPGIRGGGSAKKALLQHKSALNAALVRLKVKAKVKNTEELLPAHVRAAEKQPRYARVNGLVATVEDAKQRLAGDGFEFLGRGADPDDLAPGQKCFAEDPHVPGLLLFPPRTDLHAHPLVSDGSLILQAPSPPPVPSSVPPTAPPTSSLQDKASCMTAAALAPAAGWDVVDACAAPGNKTTHLAALLRGKGAKAGQGEGKPAGTVYAFELDERRFRLLEASLKRARAGEAVKPALGSFLECDPRRRPLSRVRAVLLDPSCSGSGIVSRHEAAAASAAAPLSAPEGPAEQEEEEKGEAGGDEEVQRLQRLAAFQRTALLHALSFPRALRVAYSTCSIHREENEDVVRGVLEDPGVASRGWRLAPALPAWPRRGLPGSLPGAGPGPGAGLEELVLRTDPLEDRTNGFFVALFERDKEDDGFASEDEGEGEGGAFPPPPRATSTSKSNPKKKKKTKEDEAGPGPAPKPGRASSSSSSLNSGASAPAPGRKPKGKGKGRKRARSGGEEEEEAEEAEEEGAGGSGSEGEDEDGALANGGSMVPGGAAGPAAGPEGTPARFRKPGGGGEAGPAGTAEGAGEGEGEGGEDLPSGKRAKTAAERQKVVVESAKKKKRAKKRRLFGKMGVDPRGAAAAASNESEAGAKKKEKKAKPEKGDREAGGPKGSKMQMSHKERREAKKQRKKEMRHQARQKGRG